MLALLGITAMIPCASLKKKSGFAAPALRLLLLRLFLVLVAGRSMDSQQPQIASTFLPLLLVTTKAQRAAKGIPQSKSVSLLIFASTSKSLP
jgi:hypothetical protein